MEPILCGIRADPPQTPSIDKQQLMIVGAIFARELKHPGRKRVEKLKAAFSLSSTDAAVRGVISTGLFLL